VQKLSRLFSFLEAGDREGLLATLCELVPECVPPLQDAAAYVLPRANGVGLGQWQEVFDDGPLNWRGRRRGHRHSTPPDLRIIDRREGLVCRRKTARVGGRRRSDIGTLLATGSSSTR
jgi:hypothetical protein